MLPRSARVAGIVFASMLGAVLLAFIVAGVWVGVRAASAQAHLRTAQATVGETVDSLHDPARAAGLVEELSRETSAARELTSDPVWRAAEHLPWAGPQLAAVSTIAAAADDVVGGALTPLAEVATAFSLDSLRPSGGRIETAVFDSIAEPARAGADQVAAAAASVGAIDGGALLAPVRDAVAEVSELLRASATATDALARASVLLPPMLGAEGERDYLIVFQNNAEWRSLGGIVGALAVVHTVDGTMQMTAQASATDFPRYEDAVLPLSDELLALYGPRPGRWLQNVTQVPDFAVTGPLAKEMWLRETGQEVDGVIAMDPVALSYLLEATGPVLLPTGDELTADNAVQLLLQDVYQRYERPRDQDAFFAAAAASVFDTVARGAGDPAAMVAALGRAGDERRLLLWSAVAEDQAVLAETSLAGGLPVTDAEASRFGVYLNDGTGSKMDYYVSADTSLTWDACVAGEDDRATGGATLTLTLTSTAPPDAATSLPRHVTGGGVYGVAAGVARTLAYLYLPEGFELTQAILSIDRGFGGGYHDGRQVLTFSADLAPGDSVTATVSVRTVAPSARTLIAEITPTISADIPATIVSDCVSP